MENPCTILFLGDERTREYVPPLAYRLRKEYDDHTLSVIDGGVRGETSREGVKRAESIGGTSPHVAVIAYGTNECERGVTRKEFRDNLCSMVDTFESTGVRVVLVAAPPGPGDGSADRGYAEVVREAAYLKRVKVADVDSFWRKEVVPFGEGFRSDGRLDDRGVTAYCEALFQVVPRAHTVVLWQYNGRECLCNYKCPYCYYAWSDKSENFFWGAPEDWRRAFKRCFGNQRLFFYLAFGEPMLGAAFHDVVEMIGDESNWSLRITSNISQDLRPLMVSRVAREGRLYINASFHPTQTDIGTFIGQLNLLRDNGIEAPVVYVMWPPHMKRFASDFTAFDSDNYLVHVRRFAGMHGGKLYPEAYSDEERRFVARYCDDATIIYMLNKKTVLDRRSYSGMHFVIVDATGNAGYDSDCFGFYTQYRTVLGNVIQPHTFRPLLEPLDYPEGAEQGTVDGVSNYLETGYRQLEGNNILSFSRQGGVFHADGPVYYKNMETDFTDGRVREEYHFPRCE